jgi:5'-3' exonuclease
MLLLADGNNMAWAGFHALRRAMEAETPEQKTRAALLGLTQSVLGMAVRGGEPPIPGRPPEAAATLAGNPVRRLAIAFDEGRPLRRRTIFPTYQLSRESNPAFAENEAFVLEAIAQFMEAARALPIDIARGVNTEADDLIAFMALEQPEATVRIASTDRDFLQLVSERLTIYSPVKRVVIDVEAFADATAPRTAVGTAVAFPRERYLDYRVASGDASDDLPGIPGVGTITAARLLADAPLDDYLDDPALASRTLGRRNAKLEAALAGDEARKAVARNRVLMDLRAAAARYPSLDGMLERHDWDEATFRAWFTDQRIAGLELDAASRAMESLAQRRDTVR